MSEIWSQIGFRPADILIPKNCDMSKWSVVACDQYTSQPDYWERVERYVGDAPSTLRITLPEIFLGQGDVNKRIDEIHQTMNRYLQDKIFEPFNDALIYVERLLSDGIVRHGLVGAVDLEEYDYSEGADGLTRATEAVVPNRLPARVSLRKGALLELPHVLMLIDDPEKTVLEPLADAKGGMRLLYDFSLMERGGHIRGYLLTHDLKKQVAKALAALADPNRFNNRFGTENKSPMLFAVGDGNHSLASAKAIYEESKNTRYEETARFSLVEICNAYDDSLVFDSINRVAFGVDPAHLTKQLMEYFPDAYFGLGKGHSFSCCHGDEESTITIPHPKASLPIGSLQAFLDDYTKRFGGTIDYIHGANVVRQLSKQRGNVGFILPAINKESLFSTVIFEGKFPRKTFSMGQANDKRYYLEARRIKL